MERRRPTFRDGVGHGARLSGMTSAARTEGEHRSLTMRELGKLTAEQVERLDHPVPVTSNGVPIAWLMPLTAGERRRASMIAMGRLRPRRREGLAGRAIASATPDGPSLSELLLEMRRQEHT